MERALGAAGVPSSLRFNAVGDSGKELVQLLNEDSAQKIGGEAVLRIDNRYDLSFQFSFFPLGLLTRQ